MCLAGAPAMAQRGRMRRIGRSFLAFACMFAPQSLKRLLYTQGLGYRIHKTARIGFSFILVDHLEMEEHARIDHFVLCKGLTEMILREHCSIGRYNWIFAVP